MKVITKFIESCADCPHMIYKIDSEKSVLECAKKEQIIISRPKKSLKATSGPLLNHLTREDLQIPSWCPLMDYVPPK
jgi:hypothetical protein